MAALDGDVQCLFAATITANLLGRKETHAAAEMEILNFHSIFLQDIILC